MKAIILAGGLGSRLSEETVVKPKPMVEIGGKPILWHIMNIFSCYGIDEFIVALGYRSEVIKEYFLNFYALNNNITVDLATGATTIQDGKQPRWKVHLVDTGLSTQTGGRVKRAERWLGDDNTFMLTYGDGVADVDLRALLRFHESHGKLATVTTVRPPARFGGIVFDGGSKVSEFTEKPQAGEGWINGGFFVLNRGIMRYIDGDATLWERDPMEGLAADGELMAYRHEGFWQPMDTLRERTLLEELWGDRFRALEVVVMAMNWAERRVFVTGATGIVGSWLVKRLLERGAYVVALVRDWDPQTELIRSGDVLRCGVVSGRLEDYATLERAINEHEIDTVFHLGAQPIVTTALRNPLPTFESNIRGSYNLLDACRIHRHMVTRVVVASSDKAYGDGPSLPYTEHMPVNGRHPYDVSKSCTDLLAMSYAATYDMPVSVARCGNIYGGGDLNWSRIVPGTIRSLWLGQRPIIRSNGRFTRDYIYVQDVVDAYMSLAERCGDADVRGEAFNFSPESNLTVLDVTEAIARLMDRRDLEPLILDEVRAEIRDQYLDSSKAEQRLAWRARYTMDAGLKETIAWYLPFFESAVRQSSPVEPCGSSKPL